MILDKNDVELIYSFIKNIGYFYPLPEQNIYFSGEEGIFRVVELYVHKDRKYTALGSIDIPSCVIVSLESGRTIKFPLDPNYLSL
ncbi:hypothetical protein G3U99_18355 [Vibrio coralliilyticus OCN008]|uniref:hypothetical protein n=1 Tax=Vibrio coralliilyticus TaxID=190893 RepID=UPI0003911DDB|nr:hypothetical protein [Vibrio coralliilyticus]ERB64292.1 hypothetical protein N779_16075 [Vibrio coralliilyticus OCN008]QIJ86232.1 hypothetical protein G3U99_18355 [Vibrio coralliilyticus OCN008]